VLGNTMDADDGATDQVAMETLRCKADGTGWLYGGNQNMLVTTIECLNQATVTGT